MNKYALYGVTAEQKGNEGYFTKTYAFFKEDDQILYHVLNETKTVRQGDEKRYLIKLDTETTGHLKQVVAVTGEEFATKLDILNIPHNIREWDKHRYFHWKLMDVETYQATAEDFKNQAMNLAENWLRNSEVREYAEQAETAAGFIYTTGSNTTQSNLMTAALYQELGNEYSYNFRKAAAVYGDKTHTEDEYDEAVEKYLTALKS